MGSFNFLAESVKQFFIGYEGQCVRIIIHILKSLHLIYIKLKIVLKKNVIHLRLCSQIYGSCCVSTKCLYILIY